MYYYIWTEFWEIDAFQQNWTNFVHAPTVAQITQAVKTDRMTPVLRSLHWLPVRQRIVFKTAVTVYKCLNGLAPSYLTEYCKSTTSDAGRHHLRSGNTRQLIIPRTSTRYGDRSFAVHGPVICNHLPHDLRSTDISLTTFRKRLKIFLFDADT